MSVFVNLHKKMKATRKDKRGFKWLNLNDILKGILYMYIINNKTTTPAMIINSIIFMLS